MIPDPVFFNWLGDDTLWPHSPGAPLMISAWRGTGSRLSVTEVEVAVEVELNLKMEAEGRMAAIKGALTSLCAINADIMYGMMGRVERWIEGRNLIAETTLFWHSMSCRCSEKSCTCDQMQDR